MLTDEEMDGRDRLDIGHGQLADTPTVIDAVEPPAGALREEGTRRPRDDRRSTTTLSACPTVISAVTSSRRT
jgi:hypothetical protein